MEEAYNKTKKKKDPEFDRANAKIRLPDEIISRLIQLKLQGPACTNKGFILDGYPRTMDNALSVFCKKDPVKLDAEGNPIEKAPVPEGEEDPDQRPFKGYDLDTTFLPQYVINLMADDEFLRQKMKEMPEEKKAGTHYTDDQMVRRLKAFREHNQEESGSQTIDFFVSACGEDKVLQEQVTDIENEKFIVDLKQFIEQGGKPCCLNLVTEEDSKFLRRWEREQKLAAKQ
jgi:adenylate kinase